MTDSTSVLLQTLAPVVVVGVLALLAQWGRRRRAVEFALVVALAALSAWFLVRGVGFALLAVSGGSAYGPSSLVVAAVAGSAVGLLGLALCAARAAGAWRARRRGGHTAPAEEAGPWRTSTRKEGTISPPLGVFRFPSDPPVYLAVWVFVAALSSFLAQLAYFGLAPEAAFEAYAEGGRMTLYDLALIEAPLLAVAALGVGIGTRRGFGETLVRLGYGPLSLGQMGVVALFVAVALVIGTVVNVLFAALQPELFGISVRTAEALYGVRDLTLAQTALFGLLLGLGAAVGEETLFRGAVQPVFGILATSVLFACMHTQYGPSLALLDLFLFSVGVGLLRRRINTTAAFAAHASYNFVLAMLGYFGAWS